MKKILSLIAVIAAIFFVSCQKEESIQSPNLVNYAGKGQQVVAAKLTEGDWKLSSVTLKYSDGTTDTDPLDICKSDDLYGYETSGEATVTYGTTVCSVTAGETNGKFANWELIENGVKLKEVYTRDLLGEPLGSVVIYTVDFINSSKLIISRVIVEPGKTYTETDTYIK